MLNRLRKHLWFRIYFSRNFFLLGLLNPHLIFIWGCLRLGLSIRFIDFVKRVVGKKIRLIAKEWKVLGCIWICLSCCWRVISFWIEGSWVRFEFWEWWMDFIVWVLCFNLIWFVIQVFVIFLFEEAEIFPLLPLEV